MKYADPWYKSPGWLARRDAALKRDKWLCQEAKRYGKHEAAETVHHIFPREEFPEYQWEMWNLISLSNKAHDAMHDRKTGVLTKSGADLLRRTARKQGIKVPTRYE